MPTRIEVNVQTGEIKEIEYVEEVVAQPAPEPVVEQPAPEVTQ